MTSFLSLLCLVMLFGMLGMAVSKQATESASGFSYLDFLRKLLALGPRLAEVYPHLVTIYNAVQAIVTILGGSPADGGLALHQIAAVEVNEEAQELEEEVLEMVLCEDRHSNADIRQQLGDGSGLRKLWAFFNSPLGRALLDFMLGRVSK